MVYVTAQRQNDLYFPNFGKLQNFKFHKCRPDCYLKVAFPSWGVAQKAVKMIRQGDATLWNQYC
jgi:hypothetical protein